MTTTQPDLQDTVLTVLTYLSDRQCALFAEKLPSGWRLGIIDQGGTVEAEGRTLHDLARAIRTFHAFTGNAA